MHNLHFYNIKSILRYYNYVPFCMSNKLQLEKNTEIKYRDKIVENNKNASASDKSS